MNPTSRPLHGPNPTLALIALLVVTPTRADVISDWNDTAIRVVKAVNPNPLPASRALAMTHVAQFDAVNAVVRGYRPYAFRRLLPTASPEAAAAQAAHRVLASLYPAQLGALDDALAASLAAVPDGTPKSEGIALGTAVAEEILARRASDGSGGVLAYTPDSGPGAWIPTPPANAPALLPHWRQVLPFTMTHPGQFRPGPPPALESAIYAADFREIKSLGDTNSATRTPEQTAIGLFHIEFVPYTLGSAARYAVTTKPLPLVESARLFALLNLVMADAFIAVWDAKFEFNYWRPVTAIRAADIDGNPATEADPAWTPLRATPPHPEYPAAHTIAAAAGAEVLGAVFGDAFPFTVESPTLPGQPRRFAKFSDFPVESGDARVWAGFHWRNSTVVGADMGRSIARQAMAEQLRGTAPPTFTKITTGAIVNDGGRSAGVAWGDFDGDGFEDLFVANNNGENDFLYRNNRDGTFARITTGPPVTDGADSVSAQWGDIDNDGDLDLFVSAGGAVASPRRNLLYQNNGNGTFDRITTGSLVTENLVTIASAWADYDNDGWLDIFTGNYFGRHVVYRGTGKGQFARAEALALDPAPGDVNGCSWGDFDNDGRLDVLVNNGGDNIQPNTLYRNLGGGSFEQLASGCLATERSYWIGSSWGDYDNDGFLDVFATQTSVTSQRRNFLFRNNTRGGFDCVVSGPTGTDTGFATGSAWGDYDNDGFLDLFVCWQEDKNNQLYRNNGDGSFTRVLTGSIVNDRGRSPACAWADYDNDGFLDLAVSNGAFVGTTGQNNCLYRNDGNGNHWLELKLIGAPSNRAAIGAKVRLTASIGGAVRRQMREVSGGGGFASQNSLIVHFGLGDALVVDTLRIEWPSGTVQELSDVRVDRLLAVIEPPRLGVAARDKRAPELTVHGGIGLDYVLDASDNLRDWLPLRTNTATGLTLGFEDADAPKHPRRFYRARNLPVPLPQAPSVRR